MCVPEHAASMCGARVRGRGFEEEQETAVVMEREGCPINADRCRVLVPMMPMGARRNTLEQHSAGILVGLHPVWLEYGEGLTPLLLYDSVKR